MNRAQRRALGKRKLWQMHVTEKGLDGKERQVAVGPRMDSQQAIAMFCEKVNKAVAEGKEKRWFNAHPVEVQQIEEQEAA